MPAADGFGQPASAAGQIVNAPTAGAVVGTAVKGGLFIAVISALFSLVFSRFSGFNPTAWLQLFTFFFGFYLLFTLLTALMEPMLLISHDTIAVRRWGTRLFKTGDPWTRYPMQPLSPRLRRGSRGGTFIQLELRDASGYDHKLMFQFANFAALQLALTAAGCQLF